jgi:large exoprotein involved in heme utilization and adhesion
VVGDGNAGNVTITSASNVIMQNSSVTTEASDASGGQITINAADSGIVQLINSKVITSVAGSDADTSGGDISIDPQFVILQNSQILAQAFAGAGGNINIISNVFLADPLSLVDASSQLGISGTVNIQAPVQNVSGELVVLSQDFSSAAALLAQQCAARVADGKFSTFVVAGRESIPVEPGGYLASPSFLTELVEPVLSRQLRQTPRSSVEGPFREYDTRLIQLARLGNACHR